MCITSARPSESLRSRLENAVDQTDAGIPELPSVCRTCVGPMHISSRSIVNEEKECEGEPQYTETSLFLIMG
jgi:hypothetical protein